MTGTGEEELVAAISALAGDGSPRLVLGIGDDAALWQPSRSNRSIITTDAAIDGVHFSAATMSRYDAGHRSMTANLSDIAAMGGRPVLATVAFGIPESMTREAVLETYRGIADCARGAGCAVAGGDLTRAPVLMLSITVVGEVRAGNVKRRSGARPGDVLAVTGPLGDSRAGLHLALNSSLEVSEAEREAAFRSHRTPAARLAEGRFFGASANVHAMMDCSDGLSTDAARMAGASHLALVIERVPAGRAATAVATAAHENPAAFALAGGEDYELLVALAPRAFEYAARRFRARFERPLEYVGRFRAGRGIFRNDGGSERPLRPDGWDHFSPKRETR